MNTTIREQVVLLDESGNSIGSAFKSDIHTAHTPLHLAFSCYVLNSRGEVLVTRRALAKKTWPGVWTNSFCGHPAPHEDVIGALSRRGFEELGVTVGNVVNALPDFRYRAVDASGVVENELCPVFTATSSEELAPNPDEVAEWAWVEPSRLIESVRATPFAFSPWLVGQLPELLARGALTLGSSS